MFLKAAILGVVWVVAAPSGALASSHKDIPVIGCIVHAVLVDTVVLNNCACVFFFLTISVFGRA